ncbi:hypothetical protein KKC17_04010 [Patescibacteria group bacterium]|nr:hypothetical protein [Patescibacteria group bacterium]
MKLLILAGGSGTRLWPLSKSNNPKQIQPFFDDFTLLQHTWRRLRQSFKIEDIFVSTTLVNLAAVKKQLPELQNNHLIVEPQSKNTAPAISLAAKVINEIYPGEVVGTINSDHYIKRVAGYLKVLRQAAKIVEKSPESILLIGLKPSYAETGYGYIKVGQTIKGLKPACRVKKFTEKPLLDQAEKYLASRDYLWNSGIFFFKPVTLEKNLSIYASAIFKFLKTQSILKKTDYYTVSANSFAKLKSIAFDYAVVEKINNLLVLPADFGWVDVGNWRSVFDIIKKKTQTNAVKGKYLGWQSTDNLIYSLSDRLIATAGIKDMAVIDTKEVLLICPINKAQAVKNLVAMLKPADLIKYL